VRKFYLTGWLTLAALACVGLLATAHSQVSAQGKDKVYEVGGDGLKIDSKLAGDDPKDTVRKDSHAKVFQVKLAAGKTYTIRLNSADTKTLDPYLRVEDSDKKQLAYNDDDPDGGLNSRLDFKCDKDGTYRIIATSFGGNQTGDFTLLIKAN